MEDRTAGGIVTSGQVDAILPALLSVQRAVGTITTDAKAKVPTKGGATYEYTYATLVAVLADLKPALNAESMVMLQGTIGGVGWLGVTTRFIHSPSGQFVETTVPFDVGEIGPRERGAFISYGRRYGITTLLALAVDDDDGKAAAAEYEMRRGSARPPADPFDMTDGAPKDEKAEAIKRFNIAFEDVVRRALAKGHMKEIKNKELVAAMASVFVRQVLKLEHTAPSELSAQELAKLHNVALTNRDKVVVYFRNGVWCDEDGYEQYRELMGGKEGA